MIGFIYFLQNPITKDIFYIGATKASLYNRLTSHYAHVRECVTGRRNFNRRCQYLSDLLPTKAEIYLLEIVENIEELDRIEGFYISLFRSWGFNLLNGNDGGVGGNTWKGLTIKKKKIASEKLSHANTGRKKTTEQIKQMSISRMGRNNPAAGKAKHPPIVAFNGDEPLRMFKFSYELTEYSGSSNHYGAIVRMLKGEMRQYKPFGLSWKWFHDCDKSIQDIVQSQYESIESPGKNDTLQCELVN